MDDHATICFNSFKPVKYDHNFEQDKVPILSLEALHRLDMFIFNLAVTHVVLSLLTFVVGVAQVLAVAEPRLSRTPGRVLSIDVHKLTVQKIHENINGKIDNIQKAPSRSNIFILLQQLI